MTVVHIDENSEIYLQFYFICKDKTHWRIKLTRGLFSFKLIKINVYFICNVNMRYSRKMFKKKCYRQIAFVLQLFKWNLHLQLLHGFLYIYELHNFERIQVEMSLTGITFPVKCRAVSFIFCLKVNIFHFVIDVYSLKNENIRLFCPKQKYHSW